jgi:hypothetical protein
VLTRSLAETAASIGPRDAGTDRRLVEPFLPTWDTLARDVRSLPATALPRDPVTLARFGLVGLPPSTWLMRRFRDERAKTLFAGLVAHVMAPLGGFATGAIGLVFALAAHARGWPVARGGSQSISDALAAYLKDLGGSVHTDYEVKRLDEPPVRPRVTRPERGGRLGDRPRQHGGGAVGEGMRHRQLGVQPLQAVALQGQGAERRGVDAEGVGRGARVVPEAGEGQLLGAGSPAHGAARLEDGHGEATAGQLHGSRQSVRPRTHHDRIEHRRHLRTPSSADGQRIRICRRTDSLGAWG